MPPVVMCRIYRVGQKTSLVTVTINLSGSVVTPTVLGGYVYILRLLISYSVYVPKVMQVGWQKTINWPTFFDPADFA